MDQALEGDLRQSIARRLEGEVERALRLVNRVREPLDFSLVVKLAGMPSVSGKAVGPLRRPFVEVPSCSLDDCRLALPCAQGQVPVHRA
jgi:hypothetical protein